MNIRCIWIQCACIGALVGASCTSRDSAAKPEASPDTVASPELKANAAPAAPESVLSKTEAEQVATQWMNALRSRDRVQLEKLSAVPFELRELVNYPKCQPAHASKPSKVAGALACLFDDQLLMEELTAQPTPVTEMISTTELPAWAASLKQSPPAHGRLVHIRLPGNGVSYQFLLLATSSGVQQVWKFAEYDPD